MSVTPEESFRRGGEYGKYLTDRLNESLARTYASYGSPSEIGALSRERDALRSASYGAAMPRGDEFISGSSFGDSLGGEQSDPYEQIRAVTQSTYAQALADAAARRANAPNDFKPIPYNPIFEEMASGRYEVPQPAEMRVDTLRAQRRRRRRERERRNAMA